MPRLRKLQKDPEDPDRFFRRRLPPKDVRHLGEYGLSPPKFSKAERAARRRQRQSQRAHAQRHPETRPRFDDPAWIAVCAQVLAAAGRRCAWCGSSKQPTVDHITPLDAGGSNAIGNLQCLCRACNKAKGNQTGIFSCPI